MINVWMVYPSRRCKRVREGIICIPTRPGQTHPRSRSDTTIIPMCTSASVNNRLHRGTVSEIENEAAIVGDISHSTFESFISVDVTGQQVR